MRILRQIVLTFITVLAWPCLAWPQATELDNSFGTGGIVTTPGTTEIVKTIFTDDNKILSLGYYYKDGISSSYDWALAKYNYDGSLDDGFGNGGLVFNVDTNNGFPATMAIQPDNKILVVGSKYYGHVEVAPDVWTSVDKSFIARYKPDGEPDLTFGDNGIIIMDFNSRSSGFSSLALLDNNRILVGGSVGSTSILLKLNPDGSVDDSFGDSGMVVFDDPDFIFLISDLTLLKEKSILCYGGEYLGADPIFWEHWSRVAIIKLDINGDVVTSFGDNGKIVIDDELSYGLNYCTKAVESDNGEILLGGYMHNGFILKINPDGSFDDGFGSGGMVQHDYPFADMQVREDGKIFVAGSKSMQAYDYGYSVCRFNRDGTIDDTFNTTGYFDLNISPDNDYLQCITLQSDGKILLSGASRTTGSGNFTIVRLITDTPNMIENIHAGTGIHVYPNPFQRVLNVKSEEAISELIIYDLAGNAVLSEAYNATDISTSVDLPQGVYIYTVITINGDTYTGKIIKQ